MSVIDQAVAGAAAATVITADMSPTVPGAGQTMTVNDATGYPSSGRFTIVIDRGNPNEEKVLITSRSGTTFTIAQRGYDGTTASTHTSGQSAVEHALPAAVVAALINHVDDGEADPHSTKLLNNARHDIEARHQFGGAYGTPVTPTALTPDIAGAAGSGNNPAREDHAHNVPTDVPVAVGTALAEGAAATFARSNHVHELGAGSIDTANQFAAGVISDENMFGTGISPVIISASDPGAVGANRIWFNTTTGKRAMLRRNAGDTAWEVLHAYDWMPYTPTYPGMFAVGNAVHFARYKRVTGGMVIINGFFRIGTTTSFAGLTNLAVALPTNAQAKDLDSFVGYPGTPTAEFFGHAAARGSLGAGVFAAVGIVPQAGASKALDRMNFFATAGSAAWSQTVPGSWAAGDRFSYFAEYEPATLEDSNWV